MAKNIWGKNEISSLGGERLQTIFISRFISHFEISFHYLIHFRPRHIHCRAVETSGRSGSGGEGVEGKGAITRSAKFALRLTLSFPMGGDRRSDEFNHIAHGIRIQIFRDASLTRRLYISERYQDSATFTYSRFKVRD